MPRKLQIKAPRAPALTINRAAIEGDQLVYIATANRRVHYRFGLSYIVYIGTTKAGASRIAASAASKASEMLALHGVRELEFHVVTCRGRKHVKTWMKLERGLILTFVTPLARFRGAIDRESAWYGPTSCVTLLSGASETSFNDSPDGQHSLAAMTALSQVSS